jgi:hypothetical protein
LLLAAAAAAISVARCTGRIAAIVRDTRQAIQLSSDWENDASLRDVVVMVASLCSSESQAARAASRPELSSSVM